MDRKGIEALTGQEVAVTRYRPRNGMPYTADRMRVVAVGVASRGRYGHGPASPGDDQPGTGALVLVEAHDGRQDRVPSRAIWSSWAEWEEYRRREDERRERNVALLAEAEAERAALSGRLRDVAEALGIGSARVMERDYGRFPVRFTDGGALVALLEQVARDRAGQKGER